MGPKGGEIGGLLLVSMVLSTAAACRSTPVSDAVDAGPDSAVAGDPAEGPLNGISKADLATFYAGDDLFGLPYREPDGLGPLYVRLSCGSCHTDALRGPGLIQKMAVVEADNITPAPDADQMTKLPFGHSIRPLLAGGGKTPLVPPMGDTTVRVSTRIGPPVIGHGYMEAVLDSEIERVQASQALLPRYHGRINHVTFTSEANPDTRFHTHKKGDVVIGRFGMKAKVATLDDFVAEALQLDIG
ncbi:MAG: di-heme oxidoredictase family protein, partial [Polyangiaceae bacterium]